MRRKIYRKDVSVFRAYDYNMRDRIISLLRERQGRPVSGEDLARTLLISRAAVWKHVQKLRKDGYDIRAVCKEGYTLCSSPDLLLAAEITAGLKTAWLGRRIIYRASIDSTNDLAKKEAFAGCPHGSIVVAEEQTGGRGRVSRGWVSPPGQGIWLSMVLRPPFLPSEAPKLTLLTAAALAAALAQYPGLKASIKWPNDLIYDRRKIAGILTEMSAEMEAVNYVVVGVGLNVSVPRDFWPEDLRAKAASLAEFVPVKRTRLLTGFLQEFERLYDKTEREGFDGALRLWRAWADVLGRQVLVAAPDKTFTGEALDLDDTGALLVKLPDGAIERVLAGDVSVRAPDGGYI